MPYWFKRIKRPSRDTDFEVEVKPISGAKHLRTTDEDCPVSGAKLESSSKAVRNAMVSGWTGIRGQKSNVRYQITEDGEREV